MSKLTSEKYEQFCHEYVSNKLNGTKAWIAVGGSQKTASVQASNLLRKPNVKARIVELIREQLSETDELTMRWVEEVKRISFYDPRLALNDDGDPINPKKLDDDTAAAIQELSDVEYIKELKNGNIEKTRSRRFRFESKVSALNLLGKYLAILSENPPEPTNNDLPEGMTSSKRRDRILELMKKLGKSVDN